MAKVLCIFRITQVPVQDGLQHIAIQTWTAPVLCGVVDIKVGNVLWIADGPVGRWCLLKPSKVEHLTVFRSDGTLSLLAWIAHKLTGEVRMEEG